MVADALYQAGGSYDELHTISLISLKLMIIQWPDNGPTWSEYPFYICPRHETVQNLSMASTFIFSSSSRDDQSVKNGILSLSRPMWLIIPKIIVNFKKECYQLQQSWRRRAKVLSRYCNPSKWEAIVRWGFDTKAPPVWHAERIQWPQGLAGLIIQAVIAQWARKTRADWIKS